MSSALLVALLVCACAAELYIDDGEIAAIRSRGARAAGLLDLPHGCMYEGRWFGDGANVRTREACLLCICSSGALSCRRRACAPLPEPPPRCHILHRRGECCPELHCPDRITLLEHGASARFEDDDYSVIATPASVRHACVEGGTVFAAGSAMTSNVACEQCFCLGGARKCVRPRCLPPPSGCKARPAPGACCPQRYYCAHTPNQRNPYDCQGPDGKRVSEGERVLMETESKCTQCFCLRGSIRCQHLSCAPPLLSCIPLIQPDQCCPHQYQCEHSKNGSERTEHLQALWQNSLEFIKNEDRSFHSSKSTKRETTVKVSTIDIDQTTLNPTTHSHTHVPQPTTKNTTAMTKVKRKTDDVPAMSSTSKTVGEDISTMSPISIKITDVTDKLSTTEKITSSLLAQEISERVTTEHPEATVKIMINGTINCTTELSSTSLSLNDTNMTDTEKINLESKPRVPYIDTSNYDTQTFSPVDIITDRNAGFDENETFTINVTSSLRTNSTQSTTTPTTTVPTKLISTNLFESLNVSKKTKEEYDYDYTEPTLPPSLPNLKIIPFVAADAVIEDDISPKESLTYPIMEREDKFPVYYPGLESKDTAYPSRREDVYRPTQYPVFVSKKIESSQYSLTQEAEHSNVGYPGVTNDLSSPVHEYTVTASLGSHVSGISKTETKMPTTSATFEIETPAINLFSPPVETEGGFLPKGPGVIDEYYAVYPSTPSGPVVPHLTTSMQLDTDKGECTSSDGRRVATGDSVNLACSICTCAWGELHCSPRPCHTPPNCKRRPAITNSVDLCCGELICDQGNRTTPVPLLTTQRFEITLNETKIPIKNDSISQSKHLPQENKPGLNNEPIVTTTSKNLEVTMHINKLDTSTIPITTVATHPKAPEKGIITTTTTAAPVDKNTQSYNHSLEYDEEDEDEGFSFGSVLKLLLSDNYDATTASPNRKKTTPFLINTSVGKLKSSTSNPAASPTKSSPLPIMESFIPVTHHYLYSPPKTLLPQNSINRIDHLVLGEATAIKTTVRPVTTTARPSPPSTTRKVPTTSRLPPRNTSSASLELDHPLINEVPRPAINSLGLGSSLLKLAGCNIYGRMYRVGRIIAELSTPCQECRCTEVGVQCRPLQC